MQCLLSLAHVEKTSRQESRLVYTTSVPICSCFLFYKEKTKFNFGNVPNVTPKLLHCTVVVDFGYS